MKELYISPDVEIVKFTAMENLANFDVGEENSGPGDFFPTVGGEGL